MGFGGPVWHASISPIRDTGLPTSVNVRLLVDALRSMALSVLAGVGDPAHQWEELGTIAFHLRRRLTPAETAVTGPVVDVRGTWEATKRQARMRRILPPGVWLDE